MHPFKVVIFFVDMLKNRVTRLMEREDGGAEKDTMATHRWTATLSGGHILRQTAVLSDDQQRLI